MSLRDDRKTVLVIDDTPANLAVISGVLKDSYRTKVATSGERGLALAQGADKPDLILLDVMMPGLDGYEVCRQLKADPQTADIPIIFLTAKTEAEDEALGLRLGAVDFIRKPFSPPIITARVLTHLTLSAAQHVLAQQNELLEERVQQRTHELSVLQDVTIMAMASLAETRDNETGNHIRRTQHYVRILALALKDHPRFRHYLTAETIELLYKSAPLHDIGKVGIPDAILLKPGRFTPDEFEIMKRHPALGRDAIAAAEKQLGQEVPFLQIAKEIAYGHQEKWDGSGYPEGVSGDAIPISARLMAVADVYDALISRRVYKDGMPHDWAVTIIRDGRGTHFDPDIVDAFLTVTDQLQAIAQRFADGEAELQAKREHRP